mgnify:CR=1 FL=1
MTKRVLAIDPGFDRLGIAVLEDKEVLFSGCIETSRKLPHQERLLEIGCAIEAVIKKWKPEDMAIESIFFNKSVNNALKVAEARGVALYEAAKAGLEVYEYSPQAVKIAVTGYGKADKIQVENMVLKLVKFQAPDGNDSKNKRLDDEMDAIALCITHLATHKTS